MLLLVSHHEGRFTSGGLSIVDLGRFGASVVDVSTRGIFEALVKRLLFSLRRTRAVSGGLEDLEAEVLAVASGDGGTTTGERQALVLGEGVRLAVTEAECVGALVLSEGTAGGRGTGGRRRGRSRRSGGSRSWGRSGSLVGDGVDGVVGDQALVLAVLDADVTLLTPAGPPRIFDDPVGRLGGHVVTDGEDTVVDLGGDAVGHDTARVCLPRGGVNSDGEGTDFGEGGGHIVFVVGDSLVGVDLGDVGLARVFAGGNLTHSGNVRIGGFRSDPTGPRIDGPLEGVLHQTTVAAVVILVARDEFLFGDRDEVVTRESPSTFDTTGGREGPARAALSLILNSGNCALLSPINLFGALELARDVVLFDLLVVFNVTLVVSFSVVVNLEFFSGHGRKFVVTELGKRVLGSEFISALHVGVVDLFTLDIFSRSEGLVVKAFVFRPRRVSKSHLDESTKSDDSDSEAVVEDLHYCFLFFEFLFF